MINKYYDYIVYSASLAGVVFALNKTRLGKSVLLINRYGFPGGDLTNALNCFQKKNQMTDSLTADIIGKIVGFRNGILYEKNTDIVLNPEAIKIVLQDYLENGGVDLLFHVEPKFISFINGINLQLVAKEGIADISSAKIFDASDDFTLLRLSGKDYIKLKQRYLNVITAKPAVQLNLDFKNILKSVELIDGRYWISLDLNSTDDFCADNKAQELLNEFNSYLQNFGSRIQLVPAQSISYYEYDFSLNNNLLSNPERLIGRNFRLDERLLKSYEIEIYLDGF